MPEISRGGPRARAHREAPDVLLTSPLPRALETAEIAAQAWGGIEPTVEDAVAS